MCTLPTIHMLSATTTAPQTSYERHKVLLILSRKKLTLTEVNSFAHDELAGSGIALLYHPVKKTDKMEKTLVGKR